MKVAFPAGVRIAALANPMPFDGALAIDSLGHVWGWGLNAVGDLCLSGLTELRPRELPIAHVTLATGARTHSLFATGSKVYACGDGQYGVLGTGSDTSSASPVPVVGLPSTARVTASRPRGRAPAHCSATGPITTGATTPPANWGTEPPKAATCRCGWRCPGPCARCSRAVAGPRTARRCPFWPTARYGPGATTTVASWATVPGSARMSLCRVDVPRGVRFVQVSSGGYASYAIDRSGRLWAWGDNRVRPARDGGKYPLATKPVTVGIRLTQITSTAQNVAGLGRNAR